MDDFVRSPRADPHANGTIWAAALWDVRTAIVDGDVGGAVKADRLVLKTLLLLGETGDRSRHTTVQEMRRARSTYAFSLRMLLRADDLLYSGEHRQVILDCFQRRRIYPSDAPPAKQFVNVSRAQLLSELKHVPNEEDIPPTEDLWSAAELESHLKALNEPGSSVLAVGDIMLGDRTTKIIRAEGPDYPFMGVLPLLRSSPIVFGNLEGPFARRAKKETRNYAYRVDPDLAPALSRANVNVVSLANNHLMDCGRSGVLETLAILAQAGIGTVGAGGDRRAAHTALIRDAGCYRVGLLGYYWNRRTAAEGELPGSARDTRDDLAADIGALRRRVDRVVVAFHWGVPYERDPLDDDRAKARVAVDCGADVVVGHHPHVIHAMEVYQDRPIFYSVGNFTFGSGNSRAEGLMVGCRFEEHETVVHVYPIYVKNRDPRVNYQPKVMRGAAARRSLLQLANLSGPHGSRLILEDTRAVLSLPYPGRQGVITNH
jgi:poly-gamma-glutamate capsule biosynthesis protein CapA/YwtB (metallophosphatase superfamily)